MSTIDPNIEQGIVNSIKVTDPFFLKECILRGFVKIWGEELRFCVLTNFELKLYRMISIGKNVQARGGLEKLPSFVTEAICLTTVKSIERIGDSCIRIQFTGGTIELYTLQKEGRDRWASTIESAVECLRH